MGIPLLIFLVLVLFLAVLLKRRGPARPELLRPRELPKTVAELEAELPVADAEGRGREQREEEAVRKRQAIAELQTRALEVAKGDPLRAVAVTREWLKEA